MAGKKKVDADRLLLIEWLTLQTNYGHQYFENMTDEELESYYRKIQRVEQDESSGLHF